MRDGVTGERQLSLIMEAQAIDLGRQAAQAVKQTIGLVDDAPPSPAGAWTQWQPTLREVGSFATVNDATVLNVQPRRIDIVKVPRNLSLRECERPYPSSFPLETLAPINPRQGPTPR